MEKQFKGISTRNILNYCKDKCCLKKWCLNQCGSKYDYIIDLAILHYTTRALKTKTMGNQQVGLTSFKPSSTTSELQPVVSKPGVKV